MKAVFRVDASSAIGTGHAVRCRTLAHAFRRRGGDVHFICRDHPGNIAASLIADGMPVTVLAGGAPAVPWRGDYADWLGVSQIQDAEQTISALKGEKPDWLIVDHYALDEQWERQLKPHVCRIMVIDDLANRPHDCDVLLDQNFRLGGSPYEGLIRGDDAHLLLGPRYALLHPEYVRHRALSRKRQASRIFVFFGGSDIANITGLALEVLSAPEFAHIAVDAVIGTNNERAGLIEELAEKRGNTHLHRNRPHLADLMSNADLALGAGGTSTWERLCLGLPTLAVSIADNQIDGCRALAKAGLITYAGHAGSVRPADIGLYLKAILKDEEGRSAQSEKGHILVDGRGAERVCEILQPTAKRDLTLRPATASDMWAYFDWVNDPAVRESAFDSRPIDQATHRDWFLRRLTDKDTFLFVLEASGLPVGQIRFEIEDGEACLDYSLDRIVRGRGWGTELVALGVRSLQERWPACIRAKVRTLNLASAAVFSNLNFKELTSPDENRRIFLLGAEEAARL